LQLFKFGFQTQLSEFLQFFNTRLSYYFLVYHAGEAKLGVFSIGVALSEAVLVVARSISMVQYSRILGEGIEKNEAKEVTSEGLKYCLMFTLIVLVVANLLPKEIFMYVFGDEFYEVKRILLWLSPGIFFASISNIIGHYFSAMGSLKILVLKSVIGVIVTFAVSVFAISRWHIDGAILVNLSSNFITFLVLWLAYRKDDD
jgi:O-antigen/teichoic acid export membrane protein